MRVLASIVIFSFSIVLGCGGTSGDDTKVALTDAEISDYCDSFCVETAKCGDSTDEKSVERQADCAKDCPASMNAMNDAMVPGFLPDMMACISDTSCDLLPTKDETTEEKMELAEYCMATQSCAANYANDANSGLIASVLGVAKRCYTEEQVAQIEQGMVESMNNEDELLSMLGCLSAELNNTIDQCFSDLKCEGLDLGKSTQDCLAPIMEALAPGEVQSESGSN